MQIGLALTVFLYPVFTEALYYSNEKSSTPDADEQNISFRIPHKILEDQTTNLNLNSNGMKEYAVRIMPEGGFFEKRDDIPYTLTNLGPVVGDDRGAASVSLYLSFFSPVTIL